MTGITERQWVTIGLYGLAGTLLAMAGWNPALWDNDRFNAILQAVILTGLLNLVGAFHFSGNQSNAQSTANTGAAFATMRAIAENKPSAPLDVTVVNAADEPVPTTDTPA